VITVDQSARIGNRGAFSPWPGPSMVRVETASQEVVLHRVELFLHRVESRYEDRQRRTL